MNLKALQKISYGLYIVCSKYNNKYNGQLANAVIQVTSKPPIIAVSINKKNLTHEYITSSKVFSISILDEKTPIKMIGTFGFRCGRDIDKINSVESKIGKTKVPIIMDNCIAFIEAEVIDNLDVGTHTIFVGKVVDAELLNDRTPMTYEFYHKVKGGRSSKNAPTYNEVNNKQEKKEVNKMDKYVCEVCGYIYDPEKGDPDNEIEPGTSFDDLPKDWVCPVCGAGKESFKKE